MESDRVQRPSNPEPHWAARALWWLVVRKPWQRILSATVIHDTYYKYQGMVHHDLYWHNPWTQQSTLIRATFPVGLDRQTVDQIHWNNLHRHGAPRWAAWVVYKVVRLLGQRAWDRD